MIIGDGTGRELHSYLKDLKVHMLKVKPKTKILYMDENFMNDFLFLFPSSLMKNTSKIADSNTFEYWGRQGVD